MRFFILWIFSVFSFFTPFFSYADDAPIQIFIRENCQHCHDEQEFLKTQNIPFQTFIIEENLDTYKRISEKFSVIGPPLTLSGNTLFEGFSNESFGENIISAYKSPSEQMTFLDAMQNPTLVSVYGKKASTCSNGSACSVSTNPTVSLPFLGEISLYTNTISFRYLSAFLLGFLDGFNPCAMWVLVVFVITLIQIGDKIKMTFVAGTFLLAETLMYGIILIAWWKLFNIISLQFADPLTIAVGILAIGSGFFFLYEGFFTDGTCQVTTVGQRKKISEQIKLLAHSPISIASFIGILLLAFSVNIIEFACSAGYPQIFTNILNGLHLEIIEKIGLLITYLFAYMIDDLIVFAIALISIEKIGIAQKYGRIFNILGGGIMIAIGITMIFEIFF